MTYNTKDLVKDGIVDFVEYRKGNLMYVVRGTDCVFPVPIEDTGDASFKATDKAMLFMRYIRKHLNSLNGTT